jgi:thymidylate synthase (FAD)
MISLGVAREMARMVLPVNLYTEFYWTVNARSLMNFIALRADAHAQWEIQRYAEAMAETFKAKMPWTYEAFLRHGWRGDNAAIAAERGALAGVETTRP